ncbi:hypothetical protein [Gorillibacterium timonense]|uniref:hypothetical protein n=1 Tax=Gorillibacterium timonense TaxID=1689269 RepID=UPI00071C3FAE|nr:hypothetical protein [Gorillibacterium timonense]
MLRALTTEEKAQSQATMKRANAELANRRKVLVQKLRKLNPDTASLRKLEEDLITIRDVKGLPVIIRKGTEIILNYEMFARLLRTLKRRPLTIRIDPGRMSIDFSGHTDGSIRLYELPVYQRELLLDLPIITLEEGD